VTDQHDPGNPQNKYRTREAQQDVRRLLLEWDPLGVGRNEHAQDEYDCMISPLLHLLYGEADETALVRLIMTEREDHFGLGANAVADAESQLG